MSGKYAPHRRGRGRGGGGGGGRDRSAPYPSSSSTDKGSSSTTTTLCLEGIPPSITKRDIITALGNFALEVSTIFFQPVRNQARIEFKGRRGAEGAFQKSLGTLTVSGTKYPLSWESAETQSPQIILPPAPPELVPQVDSFARSGARGLGRGTYDPQFRQVGHFMDTSQLVVGPEERGKIKGKIKHVV